MVDLLHWLFYLKLISCFNYVHKVGFKRPLIPIAIYVILNSHPVLSSSMEVKLIRDLLQDYEPISRPTLRQDQNLTLELGIGILQLLELKEKSQTIKMSIRLYEN